MESPVIGVDLVREVPGFATLYRGNRRGDSGRWFEFLDATDPPHPRSEKWVLMVSSQFGCAVNCSFCDAGRDGYHGNLTVEELLAQIRTVFSSRPDIEPGKVSKLKIHFARMGEPSLNPAVLGCLEHLGKMSGIPGLLPSISSVAPACALSAEFFEKLTGVKDRWFNRGNFQLQFSVHSTDEEARRAIIPIRKWTLAEMGAFGPKWWRAGDRLITLNFALADGVPLEPEVLEKHFAPDRFLVKFTAVHTTRNARDNSLTKIWYKATDRVSKLEEDLTKRGFRVIVNPCWPEEVEHCLSCGQMADSNTAGEKVVQRASREASSSDAVDAGRVASGL